MKRIISAGISILLSLGCFFTAHAASKLGEDDIQHFMNAMKPLRELGERYDFAENKRPPVENPDFADFSPMTRALEDMKDHESYGEFKRIILAAGFSSPQQWATVGDRIMRAYTSARIIREMTPEKRRKMIKSIEEVKKNEYLSPEIKKQLLNGLTQAITMADNMTESAMTESAKADQETLKPYLAKLERLFEE